MKWTAAQCCRFGWLCDDTYSVDASCSVDASPPASAVSLSAFSPVRGILAGAESSSDSPSGRFNPPGELPLAEAAAAKRASRSDLRFASVSTGTVLGASAAGEVAVGTGNVMPGLPNTRPPAPPDAKPANPPVGGKNGLVVVVDVVVVVVDVAIVVVVDAAAGV